MAAAVAMAAVVVVFALLWEAGAPPEATVILGPLAGVAVGWFVLRRSLRRRLVAARPFPPAWRRTLEGSVRYYAALPRDERTRFERDVAVFLDEAEITGVGTRVGDDLRVLVATSAVMLTFGRPAWEYTDLPEILVYARAFDRDLRCTKRREFAGVMAPGNAIALSKPDLVQSFRREDPFHVGLHEFAHLIDLEDGRFDGVPRGLGWEARRRWQALVERELALARRGESVLDDYARTNEVELFAVAIEWFFKAPRRLRARHAALYDALREYLNQDPAGRS